jgi:hypothetical protein
LREASWSMARSVPKKKFKKRIKIKNDTIG